MTNQIRRNILMSLVLWTFACLAYAAPKGEAAKVRSIIDKVLNQKLDALSKTEADNKAKAEEIAIKEKNLKWLESIQNQVNNIINF